MSGAEDDYARRLALCNYLTEPALRAAIADLGCEAGSRGLDVACGLGVHALWLARAEAMLGKCLAGRGERGEALELLRASLGRMEGIPGAVEAELELVRRILRAAEQADLERDG